MSSATDRLSSQVGFRVSGHIGGTRAARRYERGTVQGRKGLVGQDAEDRPMKDRLMRLMAVFGAVAAMALAGGASLRGF